MIFRKSLLGFFVASLLACSSAKSRDRTQDATQPETLKLRHQAAVGTVSFPELAADLGYLAPLELEFVGNTISGPQDIQTVVTGDVDFGLAFHGAIIKLIAAGAPIRAVIGGYGVDEQTFSSFFVKQDAAIHGPRDLIGKQVAMNTLGAHAEFMLREYLSRAGLSPEEARKVTLVVLPPVNTEQALRAGNIDVAALTGIFRDKALARGGLRQVFTDHELYGAFTAGSYVFTKRFIEQNPNTVRKFVEGVGRAIEWARTSSREQVIARQSAIIAKRKRQENDEVVKYWKSTGIAGTAGQLHDRELQIWIDWLVKDGELKPGQLRPSDVYTNAFNPAAAK
ncbi:MAG TPA: ABC transporter substrate-binding protein [Polyangiales bacterium]|jgi:ABC-type nitrate/sulfonate/bicarbonate transport system substrate-binding protein|nr:ABC transporter substrate-binding protein [Polyangiales bacterium]